MPQIEITQIIEQIKQEITIDSKGHGQASIRATARLADVQDSSLRRALLSAALEPSVLAKSLIQQGFELAALSSWNQGIPDIGVAAIIEYYAFDAGRYCKQQARLVCKALNRIGVRAWMQDITGWTKPAAPAETAMTQIQLLAAIAKHLAEQEQRLLEQQQQQTEILTRIAAVEVEQDRFNTPCGHKYSIMGFAKLQGLEISLAEAGGKGKKASTLCRKKGIQVERINDPRFGQVGLYPESILVEVFKVKQS
ncbi:hypothetical protein GS682_30865 [Nostoc sp. B(2019)]|nr:hypothetical protein [Nostoc sp. B(2019)]